MPFTDDKSALCLWFDGQAEEAARFYADVFPDTQILQVQPSEHDWPGGKAGDTLIVTFTLLGRSALALNGGPGEPFTNAVSVQVFTDEQEETDRYWSALIADGGEEIMCSWCRDRFGLAWQIVPRVLMAGQLHDDADIRRRVNEAMFQMKNIDHAAIQAAMNGDRSG